jgi:hypothetical protein
MNRARVPVQWEFTRKKPKHGSRLNQAECFFSIQTKQGLQHSVQRSKQDLKDLLQRFLANYNATCGPFTWTKGPQQLRHIIRVPFART